MKRIKCSVHNKSVSRKGEYKLLVFRDMDQAPVQMRLSINRLKLAFLLLAALICLLFAMAVGLVFTYRQFKASEAGRRELAASSGQVREENQALKEELWQRDQELGNLHDMAETARQKLEEIQEREQEIRSMLGLEEADGTADGKAEADGTAEDGGSDAEAAVEDNAADADASAEDGGAGEARAVASISPHDAAVTRQSFTELQAKLDLGLAELSGYSKLASSQEKEAKKSENTRAQVVALALGLLGKPYVYGGNDPDSGVDCSGFTRYVLSHGAGVGLSRTAAQQSLQGTPVTIDQARPGDLIFYGGGDSSINHVALYIGDGRVVHASTERTGVITSVWNYRTPVKIKDVLGN